MKIRNGTAEGFYPAFAPPVVKKGNIIPTKDRKACRPGARPFLWGEGTNNF